MGAAGGSFPFPKTETDFSEFTIIHLTINKISKENVFACSDFHVRASLKISLVFGVEPPDENIYGFCAAHEVLVGVPPVQLGRRVLEALCHAHSLGLRCRFTLPSSLAKT